LEGWESFVLVKRAKYSIENGLFDQLMEKWAWKILLKRYIRSRTPLGKNVWKDLNLQTSFTNLAHVKVKGMFPANNIWKVWEVSKSKILWKGDSLITLFSLNEHSIWL
jgi:hypothetical protein